jgi:hypothetical protein
MIEDHSELGHQPAENPECKQAKHTNCDKLAYCEECDTIMTCECGCHEY